ncbi:MAG: Na/Pi cotransporter family protein [Muribaculaceae bacterium]|nr:Na/Pi cotransporter family protein [Muribaculaceae bacterium]
MDYSFVKFLSLVGAVCLFLYGMKVMSEGLQKAAGNRLRSILSAMTRNRWMGIITGIVITALIQSSSASTVMVVSFVNAGLMKLAESVAVILGANIGSTFTTWIVAFFGFSMDTSLFTLPLLAIAVPMLFTKKSHYKSIAEFLIGFVFLFMGLAAISANVPNLKESPEVFEALKQYSSPTFVHMLLFYVVGLLVTMVIQSSAATFSIVLIMATKGWIPFEMGCAMVLGSNVGTTITPVLASLGGNIAAKKAAASHVLFNLVSATWMFVVFFPFVRMSAWVTQALPFGWVDPNALYSAVQAGQASTQQLIASMSWGLTIYHTLDKTVSMIVILPFYNLLVKAVEALFPSKQTDNDTEFKLKYISAGLVSASELNILSAQKEVVLMAERVERMLGMVKTLLHTKIGSNEFNELCQRVEKYEDISDRMEYEIAKFLNQVVDGKLSYDAKMRVATMLNIVSELESIGDSCQNLTKTLLRKGEAQAHFSEYNYEHIDKMFAFVSEAMSNMLSVLCDMDNVTVDDLTRSYDKERQINEYRNKCRDENIENINAKIYPYSAGVFYMDVICEAEKLGDYIVNVIDSVEEQMRRITTEEVGKPVITELNPEKAIRRD